MSRNRGGPQIVSQHYSKTNPITGENQYSEAPTPTSSFGRGGKIDNEERAQQREKERKYKEALDVWVEQQKAFKDKDYGGQGSGIASSHLLSQEGSIAQQQQKVSSTGAYDNETGEKRAKNRELLESYKTAIEAKKKQREIEREKDRQYQKLQYDEILKQDQQREELFRKMKTGEMRKSGVKTDARQTPASPIIGGYEEYAPRPRQQSRERPASSSQQQIQNQQLLQQQLEAQHEAEEQYLRERELAALREQQELQAQEEELIRLQAEAAARDRERQYQAAQAAALAARDFNREEIAHSQSGQKPAPTGSWKMSANQQSELAGNNPRRGISQKPATIIPDKVAGANSRNAKADYIAIKQKYGMHAGGFNIISHQGI